MTGPRRAPAPPLRLRLRSETAARHTISYETKTRKPDDGWGHFKPSRWGQCKPSRRAVARNDPYVSVADARRVYASLASRVKRFELLPATAGHGWNMLTSTSDGWTNLDRTLTAFLRAHAR